MNDSPCVAVPPDMPTSTPAEIWKARLVAAKSEGLTAAETATRYDVAESTVFAWRKRRFGPKNANATSVKFARIEPTRAIPTAEVRLQVAGVQILVRKGDDLAFVANVAHALVESAR